MPEMISKIIEQLGAILGPEYVQLQGEELYVQPSSTRELSETIKIAAAEKIGVDAGNYYIGPEIRPASGKKMIISLERMNQIIFDPESLCLTAQPAAKTETICQTALDLSYDFPGKTCQHQKKTIGENVAGCFNEGEPEFKCRSACLCGLEMVLDDGRVINLGGKSIKDLNNFTLAYLLAGYSEERAVLSGIHLKLMPSPQEYFWLVVSYPDLIKVQEAVLALVEKEQYQEMHSTVGVQTAYQVGILGRLQQWWPAFNDSGALLFIKIKGLVGESDQIIGSISEVLSRTNAASTFIASDDYYKDTLSSMCAGLIQDLGLDPKLQQKTNLEVSPMVAIYWQEGGPTYYFHTRP